jgi:hypothetical protein
MEKSSCSFCHSDGDSGPTTIWNFKDAKRLAIDGLLLSKPSGVDHGGGDICEGGSPCTEISKFVELVGGGASR